MAPYLGDQRRDKVFASILFGHNGRSKENICCKYINRNLTAQKQ
jgi:hypothetical protein